jgi:hypothetical protein
MSFETPAALWGLAVLLLLAIFSLWRQAAVRTVVPSLSLWKKIPERNPPIRALRRPAWRWELLCAALAIAAAVAGLAGPYLELDRPRPRRTGVVIDTSARLRDRLGRMVERARLAMKDDDATYYAADPSPRKARDPGDFRIVDVHVDVAPLIAVARAENERVVLYSDRAPAGVDAELFRGPAGNIGLVEFTASDEEIFARIANHGPARKVAATLTIDGRALEREIDLPAGERGWWEKGDFSRAMSVTLALNAGDGFATDDVAGASRVEAVETAVSVRGLESPLLRRALAAVPGVVLREAGAAVAVGVDEEPGPAAFRVKLRVPAAPRRAAVVPAAHPLTEGLRMSEIESSGVGELPSEAAGGIPLLTADGTPVMVLKGSTLHVAISIAPPTWPATASFPIFWSNVIQFARQGKSTFATARTGRPFGAGGTLAYTAGDAAIDGRLVRVSLLDARETDAEGTSSPAAAPGSGPAAAARTRKALGGWAAGAALALVLTAWILRRRGD